MSSMCSKADVKDVVDNAIAPVRSDVSHINDTLGEIKAFLNRLPCNELSGRMGKLETRLKLREEEFERVAAERKGELAAAFELIRSGPQRSEVDTIKGNVKGLQDKIDKNQAVKEARLYALLILIITIGSRFFI